MSSSEPASASVGPRLLDLEALNLEALGHSDWATRRDAVDELASLASSDTVQQLLAVVRDGHRDLARLNAVLQVLTQTTADVVPELCCLLRHPDHDVRMYAALALGERGDASAVEPLLAALADDATNVRVHAIEALGKLQAGLAVDALVEFVEQRDFELAYPALDALLAIGDGRVLPAITPLLEDSLYKPSAVEALGALGDRDVVEPLVELLADPQVPPSAVIAALLRLHGRYITRFQDDAAIPHALRAVANARHVQLLIATGNRSSPADKGATAEVLSWLEGAEIDLALAQWLAELPGSGAVRDACSRRGTALARRLAQQLPLLSAEARKAALVVLGAIGDRSVASAALDLLAQEDDPEILQQILAAVTQIGGQGAYGAARSLLGHDDSRVRQAAGKALAKLVRPGNRDDLIEDLQNSSPLVREAAVSLAAHLRVLDCREHILTLCDDSSERVRRCAVEHLPVFSDPRVLSRLHQALTSDSAVVRSSAAIALAKVADSEAAQRALAGALGDEDVWVRYFAIRSLAELNRVAPLLPAILQLAQTDPAMQVRVAAIEALSGGGTAALPALAELSQSAELDLACAALEALGAIDAPLSSRVLHTALRSDDPRKQIRAIRGLVRRQDASAIGALQAIAGGRDMRAAEEALTGLSQLPHPEAARVIVETASMPARRDRCAVALASMGERAVPALAHCLQHGDLDTRRMAVEVLTRIGSPAALANLQTALADPAPAVRFSASSSLSHLRHS